MSPPASCNTITVEAPLLFAYAFIFFLFLFLTMGIHQVNSFANLRKEVKNISTQNAKPLTNLFEKQLDIWKEGISNLSPIRRQQLKDTVNASRKKTT